MCFSSDGGASKIAKQQRADEVARQARIRAGMASIASTFDSSFTPEFFNKRAQDYMDYGLPQVDRQAQIANDKLTYALARTGNLDSSAAISKNRELTDEKNIQRQGVANEGLNEANKLRSNVENARGNVVAELNATGDNASASAGAMREVQALNQPAGFSPLGNLFSSFLSSVAQIGSNAGNGYSGFAGSRGPSFFGSSGGRGSQRVVG